MSKLIHEHLATEPRIQMWGGTTRGEWTCGCGKNMTWFDRQDVGQLQWHMLACTMAEEQPTRRAWRATIKRAVSAFTAGLPNEESATASWTDKTDGTIHTACGDADTSWRLPTLRCPTSGAGLGQRVRTPWRVSRARIAPWSSDRRTAEHAPRSADLAWL